MVNITGASRLGGYPRFHPYPSLVCKQPRINRATWNERRLHSVRIVQIIRIAMLSVWPKWPSWKKFTRRSGRGWGTSALLIVDLVILGGIWSRSTLLI